MHFTKIVFFSFSLAAILGLPLATNIPDFLIGVLFLAASFLFSLSIGAQSFTLARLPFLFANGWLVFFFLAPAEFTGKSFLAATGVIFFAVFWFCGYFFSLFKVLPNVSAENSEKFIKKYEVAGNLISVLLFLEIFLWYADAFIIYSLFGLPFFLSLLVIFFITLLSSSFILKIYSASCFKRQSGRNLPLYAWIASLAISQISWIVGFWPFGYLTAALIITIIYYAILVILKEYLFGRLETKNVIGELGFAVLIIIIIFNYTKWLPL